VKHPPDAEIKVNELSIMAHGQVFLDNEGRVFTI
jgi:hypothetical protein